MHYLSKALSFPHVSNATEQGLLAIGGDLSPERLLLAYRSGIFPWYEDGDPILWWSPDPRMVLFPERFKVSKSLRKTIRDEVFEISFNQKFPEVLAHCASIKRNGQRGTWITDEMMDAYLRLHELGHAKSVEVCNDGLLVGGLYGIDLPEKKIFCGESMFSTMSDASKVGFYYLIQALKKDHYKLIDCQLYTDHLNSLGAEEISRTNFLTYLS